MSGLANCDCCSNYIYDDEDECYVCDMSLDEDEMMKFLTGSYSECPYFSLDDEYRIVRKQM